MPLPYFFVYPIPIFFLYKAVVYSGLVIQNPPQWKIDETEHRNRAILNRAIRRRAGEPMPEPVKPITPRDLVPLMRPKPFPIAGEHNICSTAREAPLYHFDYYDYGLIPKS